MTLINCSYHVQGGYGKTDNGKDNKSVSSVIEDENTDILPSKLQDKVKILGQYLYKYLINQEIRVTSFMRREWG